MNFIYEFLRNIITTMLQLIWSSKGKITNSLSIYVKTNTGNTLTVNLDPKWDIKNVKEIVAPQMGISPEDVKIIFAGKELHNSTIIEECDLGQQSILHAVKMPKKKLKKPKITIDELSEVSELNESGSKPMNETLSDLSFDDSNNTIDDDKKRAHFYIYCSKPCNNVEAGKLRVKCSLCSSGAVTVDRDPQSWQDVLKKNRITVHCENDYCQSAQSNTQDDIQLSYAKFFFKCSNHPSLGENDEAVPLYLIKPNFKNIPCLACTDVKDTVLVFSCESSHVTCIDCFKEYCCVKLSERQFEFDDKSGYYTLPCPAGCDNSYINEVHHFRLLDNRQYEQYQRFGAEEYVLRAGGLLCPQPDCGMGIIPSNSDDVDDDNCRKIQCIGGCGYVFCKKCLNGFHLGDCDSQQPVASSSQSKFGGYSVDPNRAKDATWSEATKRTIQKSTKPCPKCRTPTERDGGCMHMFCTRAGCNFQWCWVCQTSWSRDCMGNHWFG